METNGAMTIYKKSQDYEKHIIPAVMWQGKTGSTATEHGLIISDGVLVFIPMPSDVYPEKGDIIVFGECDFVFTETEKERALRMQHEARTIMAVTVCNYGSPSMRHYEVEAV